MFGTEAALLFFLMMLFFMCVNSDLGGSGGGGGGGAGFWLTSVCSRSVRHQCSGEHSGDNFPVFEFTHFDR